MPFRPAPVPTVFSAIGLVILLNLGFWQLRRNDEATKRMADIDARITGPALGNGQLGGAPDELQWHTATVTGRYLADPPPMLMTGRFEFGDVGFDVVQPLQVDGGPVVLVDRGWIPRDGWKDVLAQTSTGDAAVTVHGLVLDARGEQWGYLAGCNRPQEGPIAATEDAPERWPLYDWEGMRKQVPGAAEVVIVEGDRLDVDQQKSRDKYPVTGYRPEPKSLPHLQYAATWFLIGGTLVALWGYAGWKRGNALAKA